MAENEEGANKPNKGKGKKFDLIGWIKNHKVISSVVAGIAVVTGIAIADNLPKGSSSPDINDPNVDPDEVKRLLEEYMKANGYANMQELYDDLEADAKQALLDEINNQLPEGTPKFESLDAVKEAAARNTYNAATVKPLSKYRGENPQADREEAKKMAIEEVQASAKNEKDNILIREGYSKTTKDGKVVADWEAYEADNNAYGQAVAKDVSEDLSDEAKLALVRTKSVNMQFAIVDDTTKAECDKIANLGDNERYDVVGYMNNDNNGLDYNDVMSRINMQEKMLKTEEGILTYADGLDTTAKAGILYDKDRYADTTVEIEKPEEEQQETVTPAPENEGGQGGAEDVVENATNSNMGAVGAPLGANIGAMTMSVGGGSSAGVIVDSAFDVASVFAGAGDAIENAVAGMVHDPATFVAYLLTVCGRLFMKAPKYCTQVAKASAMKVVESAQTGKLSKYVSAKTADRMKADLYTVGYSVDDVMNKTNKVASKAMDGVCNAIEHPIDSVKKTGGKVLSGIKKLGHGVKTAVKSLGKNDGLDNDHDAGFTPGQM